MFKQKNNLTFLKTYSQIVIKMNLHRTFQNQNASTFQFKDHSYFFFHSYVSVQSKITQQDLPEK